MFYLCLLLANPIEPLSQFCATWWLFFKISTVQCNMYEEYQLYVYITALKSWVYWVKAFLLKLCIYQNHRIYTLHRVLHFSSDLKNLPFQCKELSFYIWEVQSGCKIPCTFLQNLYKISHKNCQKSRFFILSARECKAKFWHMAPKVECRISDFIL